MVLVSPRTWPETTATAPNSPIARALQSSTPDSSAQRMLGRVTRRKVCQTEAPRVAAASSSPRPCSCISGIRVRDEGEGDEDRGQHDARQGEDDLKAALL